MPCRIAVADDFPVRYSDAVRKDAVVSEPGVYFAFQVNDDD